MEENVTFELQEMLREQREILKLSSISDNVRRDCAILLLQSIINCIKSVNGDFADRLVREGLGLVLSELGPGDSFLFNCLLETLETTSTGRQQILDILPYCMPLEEHARDEATSKILHAFKSMLRDPSSLLPIIGSLSSLPLSKEGRQEAWKLALVSLPVDLPVVVQSLLRNVTSSDEAQQALLAIRKTDDILICSLVLQALQNRENGMLLCKKYMELLNSTVEDDATVSEEALFSLLDLVVLLHLYQQDAFKTKVESLLDDLLRTNEFPFDLLLSLISVLRPRQRTLIQDCMHLALLELGLFLVLSPARLKSPCADSRIEAFVLELHHRLDRNRQEELLRSLMHLGDEVSSFQLGKRKRNDQVHWLQVSCGAVHRIIMSIAETDASCLVRFKHVFIDRLTSEKHSSGHEQICAILVKLLDASFGETLDSMELMILLQKLLFSPSWNSSGTHQENHFKVARGLILANYMVQSPALSTNDKECIYQWALQILLPVNRRTVQPQVGSNGLRFLIQWAKQPQGDPIDVFQQVKMIMANTGLVQMKEAYLQRKRSGIILAFSEAPRWATTSATSKKLAPRKKIRDLLFCVNTFLQYRGQSRPSEWKAEVCWIFTLVNTYLQQGRKDQGRRSKWAPDGWLEAALELPRFPKLKDDDDPMSIAFNKYDVSALENNSVVSRNGARFLLSNDNDFLVRKTQIESMSKLALALLLSMSLSLAVLNNSYDHLKGLRDSEKSGDLLDHRMVEVQNMLKLQQLKIFDLRSKVLLLLNCFAAMAAKSKTCDKQSDASDEFESQQKFLEEAKTQGKAIVSLLLDEVSYLNCSVLSSFLLDELDNGRLFPSEALSNQDKLHVEVIVRFRCDVMTLLMTKFSVSMIENDALRHDIALHCSSLLTKLIDSPKVNGRKTEKHSPKATHLALLRSSYLEYMIWDINYSLQQMDNRNDDDINTLLACMLQRGARVINRSRATLLSALFEQTLEYLKASLDETTSLQLVEILALLAQIDPAMYNEQALDACWKMMHTIFSIKAPSSGRKESLTFNRVTQTFLSDNGVIISKVLRSSVIKCSTSQLKDFTSQPTVRRSLLLLWSLMAQHSKNDCTEMLSSIVDEIELYLNGQENKPSSASAKVSKKIRLPSIPSLHGGTLVAFVELSFHMTLSLFAVQKAAKCVLANNPFAHLVAFPKLFKRVLTVCEQNLGLFPRRFVNHLIASCQLLLELSVSKTRECVDWRQSQPLLTRAERKAGKIDYASIRFLKAFLEEMSILSVGTVVSFCRRARNSSDYEGYNRKVTALLLASEQIANTFQHICLSHNVLPGFDPFETNAGSGDVVEESAIEHGQHGFRAQRDDSHQPTPTTDRKRRRIVPTLLKGTNMTTSHRDGTHDDDNGDDIPDQNDTEDEDEHEENWEEKVVGEDNDDDDSDDAWGSNDGFGVAGDWGSGESDKDSDTSGGLQLGGGLIHLTS